MTSHHRVLAIFAIFAIALPILVRSTDHVVGDHYGWTLNFNYTEWTEGKEFRVGDTLVFKYSAGMHNVYKVDGPSFGACQIPHENEALVSGYDVVKLNTTGRKWYLCGKGHGSHCNMGMKLFINVLPATSLPPTLSISAPAPTRPTMHIVGDEQGWKLNFDYAKWAEGKVFRVGDSLVFSYPVGKHNVFRVGGPEFQACNVPRDENLALASGYDVVSLTTSGRKWYLCGKNYGKHCEKGMKLFINVIPSTSSPSPIATPSLSPVGTVPAPSPLALAGPTQHIVGDGYGWTLDFDYNAWAQSRTFRLGDTLERETGPVGNTSEPPPRRARLSLTENMEEFGFFSVGYSVTLSVFNYPKGVHNVFKASRDDFVACNVPPEDQAMETGNDVITLATTGMKWYICGKDEGGHCSSGQKLAINVLPPTTP